MKQRIIFGTAILAIGLSVQAKEMNIFEKWRYNHDRKEAVKEWQTIIHGRDANYQQALVTFENFKSKFSATDDEIQQFRHWKKSVRNTVTPDGIIFNPQTYIDELNGFRELRQAIPNPEMEPVYYPAPASVGKKVYLQTPNQSSAGDWKSMGYRGNPRDPGQGATGNGAAEGVTIDPNNPAIVYACVRNGGLWKSTNYGVTYQPITDYFDSPHTSSLGIGKTNSNILYLSSDSKIWYSDDAGMSWEDRSTGLLGSSDEIHVDPTDANRALAASDKGLFLTTNAGLNWTKMVDGIFREIETTSNWNTLLVAKDPASSGALQNPSFFLSTDKGSTWTEKTVSNSQGTITRMYLGLKEKSVPDSLVIYSYFIKYNSTNKSNFAGLWKSIDRGNTFTEVKNPNYAYPNGTVQISGNATSGFSELGETYGGVNPYYTSSWVGEFFVDPTNENNMLTMREKCWYSVDGGQSWAYGPSYGEVAWADRRFCTSNPTKDSLYFCDDGGLWAVPFSTLFPWTGGNRASVVSKNGNISAPEGTNLTTSTYNKEVFMTGGQDVGQVFQRNGKSFQTAFADVYRGKICPTNDELYWTGGFSAKLNDTTTLSLNNQTEPDHFNPNRLYGFNGNTLYRTQSDQNAWGSGTKNIEAVDFSSTGVTSWNPWTFEQSRANGEVAFIGDESGKRLFMTENLSAAKPTWVQVKSAPAVGRYRIATHPYNQNIVAIATDKAVWISRDKGVSWEELSGFPASDVINVFFDRNTAEGLYVANSMTVWYRDETLSKWIEFNKGLPLQNNSEMEIRYYADGDSRLWISKYGRGVWSTPLYSSKKTKSLRADFTLSGVSAAKGTFSVGDTVQLNDLTSGTTTSRNWSVTGADQTLTAGNDSMPKFSFTTPGTYTVSLKVSGTSGSDSISKIGYIRINEKIKKIDSIPSTGTGGAWYLGISGVTVNGLKHGSNGNTNLFYEDLTGQTAFTNIFTDSATVAISPTQNDGTWGVSYAKVYVDFNNSGSFDASELVYAPAGKSQGHAFKFLAPVSVIKNVPLRMRVIANRLSQVSGAYASQIDQGQAEDHSIIFTTPKPVLTVNATAIGTDSISFSGTVTGAGTIIDQGFIYSAFKPTPEITDAGRVSCGTKTFTAGIGSITANRTYYVRSYTIDESGTFLSEVDTVTPKTFTIPLLESMAPTFDPATKQWSANGRVHGSNGSVDSLFVEYGTDGKFATATQIKSISGVRNQWDSVSVAMATLPRYSAVQYRLRAVVGGKPYVSTTKTFNSEKDLYAYWTFDETGTTAFDYSGNNRNATLGSTLTRISDNRGGSALQFDSIGDLATIGLANLPQPFTLMFRVKRTADNSIGNATILDGGSRRVELETWNKTRKLGVQYQNNYDRASTYSAPINEWHTIAMVCANDSIKLAVDGTYHSTFAAAGYTLPLNTFGRNGSSMNGLLDEVKVYCRALDSAGIGDAMKMVQKVSFDPIPTAKVGDPAIALNATSSKGTAVRFELVSGTSAATLAGSTVTIRDQGMVTIRAIADGSAELLADTVSQSLSIKPKDVVGILTPNGTGSLPLTISPNPARFGVDSGIRFTLSDPKMTSGSVILFDAVGNQINRIEFTLNSGVWAASWNLLNSAGIAVGSSSYSAVIQMITTDGSKKSVRKTVGVGK